MHHTYLVITVKMVKIEVYTYKGYRKIKTRVLLSWSTV